MVDDLKARLRARRGLAEGPICMKAADRIEKLEAENDRLESALRIEIWNQRMARGGKQDSVIMAINEEIASIKKVRTTISDSSAVTK